VSGFMRFSGSLLITGAMVACAGVVSWNLYDYYMNAPWTRDGHVRADVIAVAPDVSGLISKVLVKDDQMVTKGQPLFQIDQQRFKLALDQAVSAVASAKAAVAYAQADVDRYDQLAQKSFASQQTQQQAVATLAEDKANYDTAVAAQQVAQLNLDRSTVRATVDGRISNLTLRPGDYASAGTAVAALIDTSSLYVAGYFEETKLPRIKVGDSATVTLMGDSHPIRGHVTSISGGVQDPERSDTAGTLASVTSTFEWVRLATRVPVHVTVDDPDVQKQLIAGRSATIKIGS